MNLALFISTLLMAVVAIGFVAIPIVTNDRHRNRGSIKLPLLGTLIVFGIGIALYAAIGKPGAESYDPAHTSSRPSVASFRGESQSEKAGSVASLLTGLEARLAENPDDAKGWLLLAQSYELLGRSEDAAKAYDKATALGQSDEKLAARLRSIPEAPITNSQISGRVSIDPTVADVVGPDAVVYIIAKIGDNPMPVAVLRRSASELPFDFVLSDANSMVQGAGLSIGSPLTIEVKVSNSGDALAEEEGLGATLHGVDPGESESLNLTIKMSGAL